MPENNRYFKNQLRSVICFYFGQEDNFFISSDKKLVLFFEILL